MHRIASRFLLLSGLLPLALAGCKAAYSPNTYAANAAQQEAAVQRGFIIGVRQVQISANGTVGAATGAAIGGVTGSQVPGTTVVTALGAIGGSLVGGIAGSAAAEAAQNTKGWEYIVQEEPGDKLVSVTQTSKIALPIGLHVLVISDSQQARIVPDYTVQVATAPPAPPPPKIAAAPPSATPVEVQIGPLPAETDSTTPPQLAPDGIAADPPAPTPPPTPSATPAFLLYEI